MGKYNSCAYCKWNHKGGVFFFMSAPELMFNKPAVSKRNKRVISEIEKNSCYLLNEGLRALQPIPIINGIPVIILCK